ncbi:MAG: galactokinase [Phototrophicaceae bacterium]
MSVEQQVVDAFRARFGSAPAVVVRAPGRVNLIGEHTDYNDGFVMPLAIDRATWIALRPRDDRRVALEFLDFEAQAAFDLDGFQREGKQPVEYIKGMAWAMQQAGHTLTGWEGVIAGDVPIGAGLSSSAALEMAAGRAFAAVSGIAWDAPQMARWGQRTENDWLGLNTGIMDQMISAAGQAGHALLIDCRSLDFEALPLPPETAVVILDTSTRRGLVDSAYNERRQQCETAARFFAVAALRDVSVAAFEAQADQLDELTRRRARHVIYENDRTQRARIAMLASDAETLGQLMNASHRSLRDDFDVSSDALNTIVECALDHDACYGARMTGAGFGGCAVALVERARAADFAEHIHAAYAQASRLTPAVYICEAAAGAEVVAGG